MQSALEHSDGSITGWFPEHASTWTSVKTKSFWEITFSLMRKRVYPDDSVVQEDNTTERHRQSHCQHRTITHSCVTIITLMQLVEIAFHYHQLRRKKCVFFLNSASLWNTDNELYTLTVLWHACNILGYFIFFFTLIFFCLAVKLKTQNFCYEAIKSYEMSAFSKISRV